MMCQFCSKHNIITKRSVLKIILIGSMILAASCSPEFRFSNDWNCIAETQTILFPFISEDTIFHCTYKLKEKITLTVHHSHMKVLEYFQRQEPGIHSMEVHCTDVNPVVYEILQKEHFDAVTLVTFIDCALPVNSSFNQTFPSLHELTFKNDKYNAIGPYDRKYFDGLNITKLILMTNTTHGLANDIFDGISNLENVTIGYNMKSLHTDVFTKHTLQSLGLVNNQFDHLTKRSFSGVLQITELRLVSNDIKVIDSNVLEHLTNLEELFLYHNRIATLPKGLLTNISNLTRFEMFCDNNLTLPEELFARLPQLHKIVVRCNMTSVPENLFVNSANIESLDLSFNQLTELPRKFMRKLHRLVFLNLDHNLLSSLSFDFPQYMRLGRYIILSNNRLTQFQNDILYFKGDKIDLSYNQITEVGHIIENDDRAHINLSHNLITEISEDRLRKFDNKYDLAGNPFNCDCEKISAISWLITCQNYNITALKCSVPANMKGRDVSSINDGDYLCKYPPPRGCNVSSVVQVTGHIMKMNCSNANLTKVPELPKSSNFTFNELELYIDNNAITELLKFNTTDFSHLTKISARGNLIQQILPENIPMNLTMLDLSNNRLRNISRTTAMTLNGTSSLKTILFGGHFWNCDCEEENMKQFLYIKGINDWTDVKCENGQLAMEYVTLCDVGYIKLIVISASIAFLFTTVAFLIYYRHKEAIWVWLYAHNIWISEDDLDRDKQYDAFLSHAHQDDAFVLNHLLPELDNGINTYRICHHIRDWMPGEFINTQITESVHNSCRTIIVMSPSYLDSVWGKMEFRVAHTKAMMDGRTRLIVIMYIDVSNVIDLDPEIRAYLTTNTYLEWGDPRFFDRLRYALPHRRRQQSTGYGRQQHRANDMELMVYS